MSDRIPVYIEIDAVLKRCMDEGMGVYIVQTGERNTGTILLKLSDMAGQCKVLAQMRDMDGKLVWYNPMNQEILPEFDVQEYIEQAKENDPDLWIIEIEDRALENPFDL